MKVLGTDPEQIDNAEDRYKFSQILDSVNVDQPEWTEVTSVEAAKEFAQRVRSVVFSLRYKQEFDVVLAVTLCSSVLRTCSLEQR